jgi:glyoxylase-like metal-dependent hydrolase (beta-lactamase superfamily II)
MEKVEPILHSLGHDISLIDLMEGNTPGRTGSYIIKAEKVAMIETGTSHSIPYILAGLDRLGIQPVKVDYIIVTHIHLDHSGGLGLLLPYFPNATVVVHSRGARHLVNPDKLIKGARAVYGDALESLFGQIDPVPEERILTRDEEETLDLGKGRTLTFYDTPGHARHHFSIYDSVSKGVFTGDTVGVRYGPEFTGYDSEIIFPSTSPSEFDKLAVIESVEKLEKLNPSKIFHGHFGVTEPASVAFERTMETIVAFDDLAHSCYSKDNQQVILEKKLRDYMRADLVRHGYDVNAESFFAVDIPINAKGLLYSLEKKMMRLK